MSGYACVKGQDIDPVSMSLKGSAEGSVLRPPNFDGSVLGGWVDEAAAAPL